MDRKIKLENLPPQYAQLCGVLAGFVFAGFSIYVARDSLPSNAGNVAASLFAAFTSFVLLAVLYALLASDISHPRVALGIFVYGLPLGLANVALFYTLSLLAVERPQLAATLVIGRAMSVLFAPAIVLARVSIAGMYVDWSGDRRLEPYMLGWLLTIVQVVAAIVFLMWPNLTIGLKTLGGAPAYVALGSGIIAGLLSPVISTRSKEVRLHYGWAYAYLVLAFLLIIISTATASAVLR